MAHEIGHVLLRTDAHAETGLMKARRTNADFVAMSRAAIGGCTQLAAFRYREVVRKLKVCGFEFDQQAAGSHEIWFNRDTNRFQPPW